MALRSLQGAYASSKIEIGNREFPIKARPDTTRVQD
jgi:hypothetical protein